MATNRAPNDVDVREPEGLPIEDARPQTDEDTGVVDRTRIARALQDLESAKARVERDAHIVHEETRSKLVSALLPVLDNLDRAIAAAESNGDAPAVLEGVRLVRRHFETVLQGYGLERFEAVGAPFDPRIHDAKSMIVVEDPDQDRRVVAQIEAGYTFGDRLLRAAKVVVGKRM
jgi:molecular chaperone GrpE